MLETGGTIPIATPAPAACPKARWRTWFNRLVRLAFLVALAVLAWHIYHVHLGTNFHAVLRGKVYRSAQLTPETLESKVRRHGIRTVINLRGPCAGVDWYDRQCATVQQLGIGQEDICFSANRMPSQREVARLVEVLDNADPPVLLHCRQGADRTGLAAVAARLLYSDDDVPRARRHLLPRFGHYPLGNTVYMDRFFDLYEAWLARRGESHQPQLFRYWAVNDYQGGWCNQKFEAVTIAPAPRFGQPFAVHARVRNCGEQPWEFRPIARAGVHLTLYVYNDKNQPVHFSRAGLLHKQVRGGEAIDLTIHVDALPGPGRYRLVLDMIEEGHGFFQQAGAQAWEEEVVIP